MKAQIKMFETVAVLAVFFFLLIVGALFYFGAQNSALKQEKFKAAEQIGFQIALKALYMPELDCSFLATQKGNCIDSIKLEKLSELLETEQEEYFETFGYSKITINTISTDTTPDQTITLYYNELENSEIIPTRSPILVYDQIQDTYTFGIIEVLVYV
jgi:hypothetical protein